MPKKIVPTNIFIEDPKFIFIHIPKTAGMSIQKWIHLARRPTFQPVGWNGQNIRNQHRTAMYYQKQLAGQYTTFFKFAFVRNPWDRMVSYYNYTKLYHGVLISFEEFLNNNIGWKIDIQQHEYICNTGGKLIVDFVGRFENLYNDLQIVSKHIDVDLPDTMFKENATKHKHYREEYTPKTKAIISRMFEKDIELFEYEF